MIEIRAVLRSWLAGDGLRIAAERAGVDRRSARRYVEARSRPARASGHGAAWELLAGHKQQIRDWLDAGLQLTNVHGKLTGRAVVVP